MFVKSISNAGNIVYINVKTTHSPTGIKCDCKDECKAEFLENLKILEIIPAEKIAEDIYEALTNASKETLSKETLELFPSKNVDIMPIFQELIRIPKQKTAEVSI